MDPALHEQIFFLLEGLYYPWRVAPRAKARALKFFLKVQGASMTKLEPLIAGLAIAPRGTIYAFRVHGGGVALEQHSLLTVPLSSVIDHEQQ